MIKTGAISIVSASLNKITKEMKDLTEKYYDTCEKLKRRLVRYALSPAEKKIAELKRRLVLKYYGVDDEGPLSRGLYDSSVGCLKYIPKSNRKEK